MGCGVNYSFSIANNQLISQGYRGTAHLRGKAPDI